VRSGDQCFSIPDRLGDWFRHARQHPRGQAGQDAEAADRAEAGRAEAGLSGVGAEEGQRRHYRPIQVRRHVGYQTASAFVAAFRSETGLTPAAYFQTKPAS
jgi:AraC-like DNA-binding protein